MKIEKLVVGQLQTNCYLVWDEKSSETIIIDPGDDGDYLIGKINDLELKPKLIIATHGHFDHVLAIPEIKLAFNIPFFLHQKDLFLLKRSAETAHFFTGVRGDPPLMPDRFIKEGDLIEFGKEKLRVMETPGHSPGGVALYNRSGAAIIEANAVPKHNRGQAILFSGDTLFCQGVGRTDFSYGSASDLEKSTQKLLKLPEKTVVYPGHGAETTIGGESWSQKVARV